LNTETQSGISSFNFRSFQPGLEGLRGIAIILVFMRHYGGGSHGSSLVQLINAVREAGWIGVNVFFALSGFLITGILWDTRADQHYFRNFYVRRWLRIAPVYYLALLIVLGLTPVLGLVWHWQQLAYPLYLSNFLGAEFWCISSSDGHPCVEFGHFWSLAVEEQFYLIWPFLVFAIGSRVKLIRLCAIALLVCLVARMAVLWISPTEATAAYVRRLLIFQVDALLSGAAVALLLRGENAALWMQKIRTFFPYFLLATVILSYWGGHHYTPIIAETIYTTVVDITSAMFVGLAVSDGSRTKAALSFKPLRRIGRYSYGMYVFHILPRQYTIPMLPWFQKITHSFALGGLLHVATVFTAAFLVAALSYELIERRVLSLKKYFEYPMPQAGKPPDWAPEEQAA